MTYTVTGPEWHLWEWANSEKKYHSNLKMVGKMSDESLALWVQLWVSDNIHGKSGVFHREDLVVTSGTETVQHFGQCSFTLAELLVLCASLDLQGPVHMCTRLCCDCSHGYIYYVTCKFAPVLSLTSYATGSNVEVGTPWVNYKMMSLYIERVWLEMSPSSTKNNLPELQAASSCKKKESSCITDNADPLLPKIKRSKVTVQRKWADYIPKVLDVSTHPSPSTQKSSVDISDNTNNEGNGLGLSPVNPMQSSTPANWSDNGNNETPALTEFDEVSEESAELEMSKSITVLYC